MTTVSTISEPAIKELQTAYLRIKPPMCAVRLWERILTPADRERLGGNMEQAFADHGTVGMWKKLRGVSDGRAVIDVAHKLNLLDDKTAEWLKREIGDVSDDPAAAIAAAVATGALVLAESPRAAYWDGKEIEISFSNAVWIYFWELARNSKAGRSVDSFTFGENTGAEYVIKQKSRLTGLKGFPPTLGDRIKSTGRGSQRLDLPPERIRVFELETIEVLRERTA